MGWLSENKYELRLSRRDGRKIRNEPRPVVETFDIDDHGAVETMVGKHFVRMAAAAAGEDVPHWLSVRKMQNWLPEYQCEIWRTWGNPREPDLVSTSTKGWND